MQTCTPVAAAQSIDVAFLWLFARPARVTAALLAAPVLGAAGAAGCSPSQGRTLDSTHSLPLSSSPPHPAHVLLVPVLSPVTHSEARASSKTNRNTLSSLLQPCRCWEQGARPFRLASHRPSSPSTLAVAARQVVQRQARHPLANSPALGRLSALAALHRRRRSSRPPLRAPSLLPPVTMLPSQQASLLASHLPRSSSSHSNNSSRGDFLVASGSSRNNNNSQDKGSLVRLC